MRRLLATALGLAAALVGAGAAAAGNPTLTATVGPGFTIRLVDAAGAPVRQIDPGTYTVVVHDLSDSHDFHLQGPGVDVATGVEEQGDVTWTVTFQDGDYTYRCDPHASVMHGSFGVGPLPPAVTTAPAPAPQPAAQRLTATVGPGFTIAVTPTKGLRPGAATIVVRDRSAIHDFRLTGPGVSKATGVAFRGTVTWRVRLRAGVYRFRCDPHRSALRGSFRVGPAAASSGSGSAGSSPGGYYG